jgi:hypothetical protein
LITCLKSTIVPGSTSFHYSFDVDSKSVFTHTFGCNYAKTHSVVGFDQTDNLNLRLIGRGQKLFLA